MGIKAEVKKELRAAGIKTVVKSNGKTVRLGNASTVELLQAKEKLGL